MEKEIDTKDFYNRAVSVTLIWMLVGAVTFFIFLILSIFFSSLLFLSLIITSGIIYSGLIAFLLVIKSGKQLAVYAQIFKMKMKVAGIEKKINTHERMARLEETRMELERKLAEYESSTDAV
jgi:hypothetical protein